MRELCGATKSSDVAAGSTQDMPPLLSICLILGLGRTLRHIHEWSYIVHALVPVHELGLHATYMYMYIIYYQHCNPCPYNAGYLWSGLTEHVHLGAVIRMELLRSHTHWQPLSKARPEWRSPGRLWEGREVGKGREGERESMVHSTIHVHKYALANQI